LPTECSFVHCFASKPALTLATKKTLACFRPTTTRRSVVPPTKGLLLVFPTKTIVSTEALSRKAEMAGFPGETTQALVLARSRSHWIVTAIRTATVWTATVTVIQGHLSLFGAAWGQNPPQRILEHASPSQVNHHKLWVTAAAFAVVVSHVQLAPGNVPPVPPASHPANSILTDQTVHSSSRALPARLPSAPRPITTSAWEASGWSPYRHSPCSTLSLSPGKGWAL
jgi:hypothetical protein